MKEYIKFLKFILKNGNNRKNRTGINTKGIFGYSMKFNLKNEFPIVTTKKIHFKSIVHELIWFLNGNTNIKYLKENNVKIWDEWASKKGELGPIYGKQWRRWGCNSFDQIKNIIKELKNNKFSRRLIVSAWNVCELNKMALPPCHILFQFYVSNNNELSCILYQRSADAFLGVPFNISSYSLLTYLIANECNYEPKEFIWFGGDCHIYNNHIEKVRIQINRKPLKLPQLIILRKANNIFDYRFEDLKLNNYKYHGVLKGDVAV